MSESSASAALLDEDYQRLLEFRTELRRFLRWSEEAAEQAGLTPSLHQLLVVIRGHAGRDGPTIGAAAEALLIRHHSAVELAQRAEAAGLIVRERDAVDHRRMHLRLTGEGREQLEGLTRRHMGRIEALADALEAVVGPGRSAPADG